VFTVQTLQLAARTQLLVSTAKDGFATTQARAVAPTCTIAKGTHTLLLTINPLSLQSQQAACRLTRRNAAPALRARPAIARRARASVAVRAEVPTAAGVSVVERPPVDVVDAQEPSLAPEVPQGGDPW